MSATLDTVKLVLAPPGPLCRQVLAAAGLEFEVVEPTVADAPALSSAVGPRQMAESLAFFRASAVAEREPDACVLAVCTLIEAGGEVFGSPPGRIEAEQMLRKLAGTRHAVITGVALVEPGQRRLIASDVTYVRLGQMPEGDITRYLASGNWLGIAGAYASPEMAEEYVEEVDGDFSNLLGVPVELLTRMLAELHDHPDAHRSV